MKKIGIVLVGIVILVGVIYCLPKEEKEVLIEEKESTNTSLAFYLEQEDGNYLESTSLYVPITQHQYGKRINYI